MQTMRQQNFVYKQREAKQNKAEKLYMQEKTLLE